jgi:hypothetical protein
MAQIVGRSGEIQAARHGVAYFDAAHHTQIGVYQACLWPKFQKYEKNVA